MRYLGLLFGAILFCALNTSAQENTPNSFSLGVPSFETVIVPPPANSPASIGPVAVAPGIAGTPATLSLAPTADPPQLVQGVFETYSWQAYIGYSYIRFYEIPSLTQNTNGFSYGMVYYFTDWFGADGEFDATHLTQDNFGGWLLMGAGGPRFRWSAPRGLEVWGHVLGGYSHFTPQTAYGDQHAFAYEAGGGLDINAHHRRLAYRIEADMIGTRYFSTYQYSPKVSMGIVFKF
jgi:hypothetical protein